MWKQLKAFYQPLQKCPLFCIIKCFFRHFSCFSLRVCITAPFIYQSSISGNRSRPSTLVVKCWFKVRPKLFHIYYCTALFDQINNSQLTLQQISAQIHYRILYEQKKKSENRRSPNLTLQVRGILGEQVHKHTTFFIIYRKSPIRCRLSIILDSNFPRLVSEVLQKLSLLE